MAVSVYAAIQQLFLLFFQEEHRLLARQAWVLGLANLALVVVLWVLLSFLVNDLFESNIYRKPFLITYINTSCFAFYMIPYLRYEGLSLAAFWKKLWSDYRAPGSAIPAHFDDENDGYGSSDTANGLITVDDSSVAPDTGRDIISVYETALLSLQFIVLWFLANLLTNTSLSYTLVALQTILLLTLSFFTLFIGYLCLIERISQNKMLGLILSSAGVLIVTKVDATVNTASGEGSPALWTLWGNFLALLGAIIYGVYTVMLKFKTMLRGLHRERTLNTHLFFGFVGIYCLVFVWPLLVVLHFTKVEPFEMPPTGHVTAMLLINAATTFVSDFCWCKAVLLTSPLTVTVGLSLTIPLAMVGDWFIKGFQVNGWYLFGACIVTIGFLVINKDEEEDFGAAAE